MATKKILAIPYKSVTTTEMNSLTDMVVNERVNNTDTQTVWEYNGTIWKNTGAAVLNPEYIILDHPIIESEFATLAVGSLFYTSELGGDWLLKTSADTYYNLGSEISPLMKNGDTSTHLNGQPVYIFGGTGKLPVVKLASASAENTSYTIALATQDVLHTGNRRGRYCTFGVANGIAITNVKQTGENISLWIEGAPLFLSTETGKLTTVRPIAPNHGVLIGYLVDVTGANCSIFVNTNVGAELGELHDVDLTKTKTTPVDADNVLLQDSVDNSIWKKLSWLNLKGTIRTYLLGLANTWDLLQTFSSGVKTGKIQAISNAANGIKITKEDGTTVILCVDTLNSRLGIGTSLPRAPFEIYTDGLSNIGSFLLDQPSLPNGTTQNGPHFFFKSGGVDRGWLGFFDSSTHGSGTALNLRSMSDVRIGASISSPPDLIIKVGGAIGISTLIPETKLDINGTSTFRDYIYLSNGTHTGDAVGDRRIKVTSSILEFQRCTVLSATKGGGTWVVDASLDATGKWSFSGTARKKWNKYTANTVTLAAGTSTSTVTDLQSMADGTFYQINEAAATPAVDLIVDFASVTAFEIVRVLGSYVGAGNHALAIQVYNWNTASWNTFNAMQNDFSDNTTPIYGDYQFTVFDDTNYIGTAGNLGKVRVRLLHPMSGNTSHRTYIDEISLRQ